MKRNVFLMGAAVLLLAVLVYGCATMSVEERKALWLKPESNRYNLETKFADKNVPISQQSFIYCDGHSINSGSAITNTKPVSVVVLPAGNKQFGVMYLYGNRRYEWTLTPNLEPGQSYWLTDPYWEGPRNYGDQRIILIPLTKAGIESYTRRMWDKDNTDFLYFFTKKDWSSYEEYNEFVTKVWQIRMEETKKQIK